MAGGWQCAMSAVAQQSETYFNMAVKGQSNDLSTDAVVEAVLVDKDNLSSQELEEIDEEESVDENPKKMLSVRRLNRVFRHLTCLIYMMQIWNCIRNACEHKLKHLTAYFNVLLIH